MFSQAISRYFARTGGKYLRAAQQTMDMPARSASPGQPSFQSQAGQRILKRGLDIAAGLVGTSLLWPISVVVMPGIMLSSKGGIFFKQAREGKDGKLLQVIKFRTMTSFTSANIFDPHTWQASQKLRENIDPRVTTFGHWLRTTGLDELPQFLSLLTGEMTLVGCRALPIDLLESLSINTTPNWRIIRRQAPPAIIPAPVAYLGRFPTAEENVALEMYYLSQATIQEDLKLMARTVLYLLLGKHS